VTTLLSLIGVLMLAQLAPPTHLRGVIYADGPQIPKTAIVAAGLQVPSWTAQFDPGTGASASASGSDAAVSTPSLSGSARQFSMSFAKSGGELFHVSFAKDTAATHFVYSAAIWLPASTDLANVELDMNQVLANGDTVIYGFQCDGYSSTWDYTENAGTPAAPKDTWLHSSQPCNPRKWALNAWHNFAVEYSCSAEAVTYQTVWFDGAQYPINATVPSGFTLGWATGTLLINFQLDGLGASGSNVVYLDDVTVSRW
jgi:hypothetical protein